MTALRKFKGLSQDDLNRVLRYEPDTGLFYWRVARGRAPAGALAGCGADERGYVRIRVLGGFFLAHRLAWFMTYGDCPDYIDHKNLDPSDNRLENLRPATQAQNNANQRPQSRNKTGFKGVKRGRNGGFVASIKWNKRDTYLGTFRTAEEAHAAYISAARRLYGEFARVG